MKVVIIGGVAAGMSAAARLRRLDERAEIVVLERNAYVSFANCGLPYHIGGVIPDREDLILHTPDSLKAALHLDVRVQHEALAIDRAAKCVDVCELRANRTYREPYDKLILCPGAQPVRPSWPGGDHPLLLTLRNLDDMDALLRQLRPDTHHALVIGGGYIGLEMAENLKRRGLTVALIEKLDQVLPPMDPEMTRPLETHLRRHGVHLLMGAGVTAVSDAQGRPAVTLENGTRLVGNMALLAVGIRPEIGLAQAAGLELGPRGGIWVDAGLRTSDPDIYAAGDAVETADAVTGQPALIPLAGPANRQGRLIADALCGRRVAYTGTQGTALVKVFDLTAGLTGASEKTLRRLGLPYRKIYLHATQHAGYYPAAALLHIKLLFAPETGRLLGAQIVGGEGVDKRTDVLATALRAGLTVFDLETLELAYAPPYGSAKDPVNLAGFVAANLLRGDVRFWYAEDYPAQTAGGLILDVRGSAEYAAGHIPGALHLPLPALRGQLGELPRGRPLFVYCKVGYRSYLAYRLLVQHGFTPVSTLAGGLLTFSATHALESARQ